MEKGILVIISGFSGVGKGTVVKMLSEEYDSYSVSVSVTSRDPRPGETEGKEYFFRSEAVFESMIAEGRFIEYARYSDHYYGTLSEYVFEKMYAGRNVILEIDVQGALQIKEKYPEALLLFLTTPSAAELERRLRERGTETEDEIQRRLAKASEETAYMKDYDYVIVNDNLQTCVEKVHQVIQAQHELARNRQGLIERITEELSRFHKND